MQHKHLALLHKRHKELGALNVNVNQVHRDSFSFNDKVARHIGAIVGTMWFCYGLAALLIGWPLLQALLPLFHQVSFDPYPYAFLFFCLGGIMQSLLMPLLIVKQNLDGRHSDLRAENDFLVNQESKVILEQHTQYLTHLVQINETETLKHSDMLETILAKLDEQGAMLKTLSTRATRSTKTHD